MEQQVEAGNTPLLRAPVDVLMAILRLIDQLSLVRLGATSKAARELALRPELWSTIQLPKFKTSKESAMAAAMIRLCGSGTLQLDTSQYTNMEDSVLDAAARTCSKLVRVNVSGCRYARDAIVLLADRCKELLFLRVAACPRVSDREIRGIACGGGHRLIGLDISSVSSSLSDEALRDLGRCTALQELTIATAKKITDRGIHDMLFTNPDDIGRGFPRALGGAGAGRLRSLELANCELLRDDSLLFIARACRDVVSLDISLSDNFTSRGVSAVLESCTQLTALDLLGVARLDDEALQFLPSSLRSLSLAACKIGDAGAREIANRCPDLRALDISANMVSDEGAVPLASLASLRALSLSWTNITDTTLEAVASGLPDLLVFRVRGNTQRRNGEQEYGVSAEGTRKLAEALTCLIDLDVRDCDFSLPSARALFPSLAVFNGKKRAKFTLQDPHPSSLLSSDPAGRRAPQCSLRRTGATFALQKAFQCRTCFISGKHMLCEQCSVSCHAGHDLVPFGLQELYCDCVFLCAGTCACLSLKQKDPP